MRPAPATPAASRKSRRVISGAALMSRSLRRAMDGGADALIRAAATDVGHGGVDAGGGGVTLTVSRLPFTVKLMAAMTGRPRGRWKGSMEKTCSGGRADGRGGGASSSIRTRDLATGSV